MIKMCQLTLVTPIQPDILNPPLLWLTSRKLLWLDLQPVDIKSWWRHNWKSAQVVNSHPTIQQPGFDLPRQQWSLLNLQKEMATYRHWSVLLWRDPDNVPHCRILSPDKTEWQLISSTLCRWRRCFVVDQLWLMTRIREEDFAICSENWLVTVITLLKSPILQCWRK